MGYLKVVENGKPFWINRNNIQMVTVRKEEISKPPASGIIAKATIETVWWADIICAGPMVSLKKQSKEEAEKWLVDNVMEA